MAYDLHVHTTLSIGENSVEDVASMGKQLGLSGLGIVQYYPSARELPEIEGIDLISSVMIKPAKPEELAKLIGSAREKAEILMVHGGDYDVNRAACENSAVDMLCHPELGRKDSGLDHICARAAHDNNVAIEVNFREVLESFKRNRIYILSALRKNIDLCKKYDTKIITNSSAVTKWGMRSARELAAIANLLGLDLGKAIETTSSIPEQMIKENREKLAGKRYEGVREVD